MRDMPKNQLYEAVKSLVETSESQSYIHLGQQKLFTLFSAAFQFMLFKSTKEAGAYIVRIEDSSLAERLAKRSKDPSTRRFIQSMLLPRKVNYGKSTFYLDFFHFGTWNMTSEIPKEKLKCAIVVKNTSSRPMIEVNEDPEEPSIYPADLPTDYYLSSLVENVPLTINIAFGPAAENAHELNFPFIPQENEKIKGVHIAKGLDLDFDKS